MGTAFFSRCRKQPIRSTTDSLGAVMSTPPGAQHTAPNNVVQIMTPGGAYSGPAPKNGDFTTGLFDTFMRKITCGDTGPPPLTPIGPCLHDAVFGSCIKFGQTIENLDSLEAGSIV